MLNNKGENNATFGLFLNITPFFLLGRTILFYFYGC